MWITDFGLAQVQSDVRLTMTGDLVGTLRYMSPEQALGRPAVVDHRTDVYSLGVTLYELLTLRPAFAGTDRQVLMRQIAAEEPPPPRSLNRAVPAEPETVVLKAMAKAPEERYQAAHELADDLRRFLEHRPVLARRPTLWQRLVKWARRNRTLVAAAILSLAAVSLVVVAALAVGYVQVSDALGKEKEALEKETQASYFYRTALAHREWAAGNLGRAELLLDECRPAAGRPDLRHWEWNYLNRLCRAGPLTLSVLGKGGGAWSVAFAPDGRSIAAGYGDGVIRVWDAVTGKEVRRLLGHQRAVLGVSFSPDGVQLASAGADGTVRVWDVKAGHEVLALEADAVAVLCVGFSPDGAYLASGGKDQTVKVWEAATGRLVSQFAGHSAMVRCVSFSHDGHYLASAAYEKSILVWDLKTGQEVRRTPPYPEQILAVAFSPGGGQLLSGGTNGTIRLWAFPGLAERYSRKGSAARAPDSQPWASRSAPTAPASSRPSGAVAKRWWSGMRPTERSC
jgi:eukaryotic-like serine/threonine-protein kinase